MTARTDPQRRAPIAYPLTGGRGQPSELFVNIHRIPVGDYAPGLAHKTRASAERVARLHRLHGTGILYRIHIKPKVSQ